MEAHTASSYRTGSMNNDVLRRIHSAFMIESRFVGSKEEGKAGKTSQDVDSTAHAEVQYRYTGVTSRGDRNI